MARQLFIGLITEGPTDVRFLQSVVEMLDCGKSAT